MITWHSSIAGTTGAGKPSDQSFSKPGRVLLLVLLARRVVRSGAGSGGRIVPDRRRRSTGLGITSHSHGRLLCARECVAPVVIPVFVARLIRVFNCRASRVRAPPSCIRLFMEPRLSTEARSRSVQMPPQFEVGSSTMLPAAQCTAGVGEPKVVQDSFSQKSPRNQRKTIMSNRSPPGDGSDLLLKRQSNPRHLHLQIQGTNKVPPPTRRWHFDLHISPSGWRDSNSRLLRPEQRQ
jgi:hypothetical protein